MLFCTEINDNGVQCVAAGLVMQLLYQGSTLLATWQHFLRLSGGLRSGVCAHADCDNTNESFHLKTFFYGV